MADSAMFFCKICDSQMNSQSMWDNHIKGKRHLKNEKTKNDKNALVTTEQPVIARNKQTTKCAKIEVDIESVTEPVVGLDYICELQYPDTTMHPSYYCNLCSTTFGFLVIIDHITSAKHRLNYIKETDREGYQIIESMLDSKIPLDGLALERAATLEQKHGRGIVEVKLEESKYSAMRKRPGNPLKDDVAQKKPNAPSSVDEESNFDTKTKEFLGRMPYFDIDTKLQIIEELSALKVTSDNEARDVMNVITNLTQLLMQYKMRHLTPNQQNLPMRFPPEGGWMRMGPTGFPPQNLREEMDPSIPKMFKMPVTYPQSRGGNQHLTFHGAHGHTH